MSAARRPDPQRARRGAPLPGPANNLPPDRLFFRPPPGPAADCVHNRKHNPMHLNELKALPVSELLKQAEALEFDNAGRMR